MAQVLDLTTHISRTILVEGGFNPITPEVKDWYDVTIRASSGTVNVATSSGDAAADRGISVPIDGQLTMTIGPGTQLFAGSSAGEIVSVALTPMPLGLRYLAMLEHHGQMLKRLLRPRPKSD